ncbi:MAG: recombinase family protein [Bdellovibrio sp.]|nr:recombinase family protein [Bdellovibrio sp.]
MEKAKKVAVYLRVSTQDQSTDMQRDELLQFVENRRWTVFQVYCDKATGTNGNRADLKQLMQDARLRRFDVVCVWKLDRFFRSLKDLLVTISEFQALGIEFVALRDQIDLTTPVGRLTLQVLGCLGEFEASLIKARVVAGLAQAKKRGVRLGRPQVVDVSRVQKLKEEGNSLSQIAKILNVSKTAVHNTLKKSKLQIVEKTEAEVPLLPGQKASDL